MRLQGHEHFDQEDTHLKDDGGQSFGSFTQSIPHDHKDCKFPFIENTDKKDTNYDSGNDGTDSPLKMGDLLPQMSRTPIKVTPLISVAMIDPDTACHGSDLPPRKNP